MGADANYGDIYICRRVGAADDVTAVCSTVSSGQAAPSLKQSTDRICFNS